MHSNLDATRRLRELKSEFVEFPPISISSSRWDNGMAEKPDVWKERCCHYSRAV